MNVLLDTHILLWHMADDSSLPPLFRRIIEDPDVTAWVSHASLWEIAIKASLGKLEFIQSFAALESRLLESGFSLLGFSFAHFETLRALPFLHHDPFDRMLIAQGIAEQFPIMTVDRFFPAYAVQLIGSNP
jgi:PIN domain nuclease of toxin-antitoxin system